MRTKFIAPPLCEEVKPRADYAISAPPVGSARRRSLRDDGLIRSARGIVRIASFGLASRSEAVVGENTNHDRCLAVVFIVVGSLAALASSSSSGRR